MDIENCNGLVDELKKHMDDWRDFAIIGPQGDLRNYLYPQPDFPIVPETMEILCHDCYLDARNGCGTCGGPVEDTKFQNENGFLCKKCLAEILG